MKGKHTILIVLFFSFSQFFSACKKEKVEETEFPFEVGAFKYLPMYLGSYWYYTEYDMLSGKIEVAKEFSIHDSIYGFIFTYNDSMKLKSWGRWERDNNDLESFKGPNGTLLFTTKYTHLPQDSIIVLDSNSTFERGILGGITMLETKFGSIPCIVTVGKGKSPNTYLWKRYYGEGIGVVQYDDYYIMANGDTVEHYRTELDSFFINR